MRSFTSSAAELAATMVQDDAPVSGCSFDALYASQFKFVWRSLHRMGVHPSAIEDAVQDTFIILHRRLDKLRPDASARAFLFGIALRVARDYRRRLRRKGAAEFDETLAASPETGPFDVTAKAEAVRLVDTFLSSLDEDKRAIFALAELEGMSAPEIGEALGVKLNTVYSRLRTARERFVAFLAEAGSRHG